MATHRIAGPAGLRPGVQRIGPASDSPAASHPILPLERRHLSRGPSVEEHDLVGVIDPASIDTDHPQLIANLGNAFERALSVGDPEAELVMVVSPEGNLDFLVSAELERDALLHARTVDGPTAAIPIGELLMTLASGPARSGFTSADWPVGGWQPLPGWTEPQLPLAVEDRLVAIFAKLLTHWANDLIDYDFETSQMLEAQADLQGEHAVVGEQRILDRAEISRRGWQSRSFTLDMAQSILKTMNQTTTNILEDF